MQWNTLLEKNLDSRHDLHTSKKVAPLGDYRINERARDRRMQNLMGLTPKVSKREIIIEDLNKDDRPETEIERTEKNRKRAEIISEEVSYVAMKRDGSAWEDEDGYTAILEPPAFRDGYNTTLRVKPGQEAHLHNGLKSLNVVSNPQSQKYQQTSRDLILDISKRPEFSKLLGNYFMKSLVSGLSGLKSRSIEGNFTFRSEKSTDKMNGIGVVSEAQKSEESPEIEAILRNEIEILMRSLQISEAPVGEPKECVIGEDSKRNESLLSRALGNAFVNIGMTLPAGKREDSKRNDTVALKIGMKMMSDVSGMASSSQVEPSIRKEVAVALGRSIMHLASAAQASRSTKSDYKFKDRTSEHAIGLLTLQMIESAASRGSNFKISDAKRREIVAKAIGKTLLEMDGGDLIRDLMTDRNKIENAQLNRVQSIQGPEATKTKSEVTIKNPRELMISRTESISGPAVTTKNLATFTKNKKNHDALIKRYTLPVRDAPPPFVPRSLKI